MRKKKQLILFLLCFPLGNSLFAAWVITYSMTPSQPAYAAITGSGTETTIPNFGFCPDQTVSPVLPIGFTFQFDGTNYSQFVATDNGLLILGNNPALPTCGGNAGNPSDIPNNLADATITRPFIAPLWEELQFKPVSAFGSGCYRTVGPVGSRIFTMEWSKMCWRAPTNQDQISFQVVLYEGTNIIDFNYFDGPDPLGTLPTASIGLGAIAPGTYYSLNNSTNTAVASSTVNNSNISVKPVTNQRYRWTPTGGLATELISFTGINFGTENHLQWIAGAQTNNDYFTLLHSADGENFSEVQIVDGAGTWSMPLPYSAIDHNPFKGTSYYKLKWTDFNGQFSYSEIIALNDPEEIDSASVFPNPANTYLSVAYLKSDAHYSILDVTGKIIREGDLPVSDPRIDVSQITDGFYFLRINEKLVCKIFIQHG